MRNRDAQYSLFGSPTIYTKTVRPSDLSVLCNQRVSALSTMKVVIYYQTHLDFISKYALNNAKDKPYKRQRGFL